MIHFDHALLCEAKGVSVGQPDGANCWAQQSFASMSRPQATLFRMQTLGTKYLDLVSAGSRDSPGIGHLLAFWGNDFTARVSCCSSSTWSCLRWFGRD